MTDSKIPSPATERCDSDPGDETQRNFRYQHAYGVVLLLGAHRGNLPYLEVICEQQEDFLCQRRDGRFDAWQVKTATPENGHLKLNSPSLRDSLYRFIRLDCNFPGSVCDFHFVSNVEVLDSQAEALAKQSPQQLVEASRTGDNQAERCAPFHKWIAQAQGECACSRDQVLRTLSRVRFAKGPGRESFRNEILTDHLSTTDFCDKLTMRQLDDLLDELIDIVARASSLDVRDPVRHWLAKDSSWEQDPRLAAKRILVARLPTLVAEAKRCPFAFAPGGYLLPGQHEKRLAVLDAKLSRGGLTEYINLMRQRTISAEQHLLEMMQRKGAESGQVFNQIASLVEGECMEARLAASMGPRPYGETMLLDVSKRLRAAADVRSAMVHGQQYELLSGVAGLLTEECRVWWSDKFTIEEGET